MHALDSIAGSNVIVPMKGTYLSHFSLFNTRDGHCVSPSLFILFLWKNRYPDHVPTLDFHTTWGKELSQCGGKLFRLMRDNIDFLYFCLVVRCGKRFSELRKDLLCEEDRFSFPTSPGRGTSTSTMCSPEGSNPSKDYSTAELLGLLPSTQFRILLKVLCFPTKSIGRENHLQIKTIPNQQAKEGADWALCSVSLTSSRKAPLYTEAHSPELLLTRD